MGRSYAPRAPPGSAAGAQSRAFWLVLAEVAEIPRHLGIVQQPLDPPGLVEALVGEEPEPGGELEAEALGDLALEVSGVLAQGLEHVGLVAAEQRLGVDPRLAQVRRHAHF